MSRLEGSFNTRLSSGATSMDSLSRKMVFATRPIPILLADRVARRLREGGFEGRTVALKLRFADFTTVGRSQTLGEPSAVGQRLGEAARELLAGIELRQAVRLIGVRAENLVPAGSAALTLWDADEDWRKVEDALDDAADRFGGGVVTRASLVGRRDRVTGGRGEADVRRRGEAPGGRTHGGAER